MYKLSKDENEMIIFPVLYFVLPNLSYKSNMNIIKPQTIHFKTIVQCNAVFYLAFDTPDLYTNINIISETT